ncbi:MAG: four helix bundle protein [Prevotellaceae bacterium]|jgi:four helix bundle protein|nr:four helix bundle protein [Prevotellaceae bacterium]
MKIENIIQQKSKAFAIRIVNFYKYLVSNNEFVLSKQILRSGTAVGALMSESEFAQSQKDFLNKQYIALKEASETRYWLELLYETNFISNEEFLSLNNDCQELIKMLVASTKTLKKQIADSK